MSAKAAKQKRHETYSRGAPWPPFKGRGDLLAILWDAVEFWPPNYFRALFGGLGKVPVPAPEWSEFAVLNPFEPGRLVRYLRDLTVPASTGEKPDLVPDGVGRVFWRPSHVLPFPDHQGRRGGFPRESWFFINGVATDCTVVEKNAAYLASLFHRPLTVIHNTTASLGVDLVECAVGKRSQWMTEPARVALPEIADALNNPLRDRVVVLAHSQGTIIMANVLRALIEPDFHEELFAPYLESGRPEEMALIRDLEDPAHLAKLELYCFATCADVMEYAGSVRRKGAEVPVPWIEHFGNEYDLVARLGVLAPHPYEHEIHIDGPVYRRDGGWGHLLNEHYLHPLKQHLLEPEGEANPYTLFTESHPWGAEVPRLYQYFEGGCPVG